MRIYLNIFTTEEEVAQFRFIDPQFLLFFTFSIWYESNTNICNDDEYFFFQTCGLGNFLFGKKDGIEFLTRIKSNNCPDNMEKRPERKVRFRWSFLLSFCCCYLLLLDDPTRNERFFVLQTLFTWHSFHLYSNKNKPWFYISFMICRIEPPIHVYIENSRQKTKTLKMGSIAF